MYLPWGITKRDNEDNDAALSRSWKEVVQHALTLRHIAIQIVELNQTPSEELIKSTHRILTDGIDGQDGGKAATYSGIYRTETVTAGLNNFTPPEQVPTEIKRLVKNFEEDIQKAEKEGQIDPFVLSSKYCHRFVNIHPFIDGNRLILNAILLKYVGIVVPLRDEERDREEYLGIAVSASMDELHVPEDERSRVAWSGLASYVLKKGTL